MTTWRDCWSLRRHHESELVDRTAGSTKDVTVNFFESLALIKQDHAFGARFAGGQATAYILLFEMFRFLRSLGHAFPFANWEGCGMLRAGAQAYVLGRATAVLRDC